jgi:hypothetical protein
MHTDTPNHLDRGLLVSLIAALYSMIPDPYKVNPPLNIYFLLKH